MRTSVTRRRKSVRTQHADITRDPNPGPWAISDTAAHATSLVARTHSLRLDVFGHFRPQPPGSWAGPGGHSLLPPSLRGQCQRARAEVARRRPAKGVIAVQVTTA
jgi:hypothetical protein